MTGFRFDPSTSEVTPFNKLSQDGTLAGSSTLDLKEVLEALHLMVLARTFDEKGIAMQRQGRFGTFSSVRGQEASIVGAAMALDPTRDWLAPQYRELPALIRHGYPLENFALYFLGNLGGAVIPQHVNMLPLQISLGAQVPQAVGIAWGLKQQGSDGVVTTFFGDGTSSEGDIHESLNLAGVVKAPVIFFLQNNGWAISTPRESQTASKSLAVRALGYGIHGVTVDGNDLLAVHEVMQEAVARARAGEGPTLIESITYRTGAHNTADDPTRYLNDEVYQSWLKKDPIDRVENYLRAIGEWDDTKAQELRDQCAEEVDQAMNIARNTPVPTAGALFDHVYADPPERLVRQREQWVNRNAGA